MGTTAERILDEPLLTTGIGVAFSRTTHTRPQRRS